ncbi:MAG: hypothetical protein IT431_03460 [Phycisphaerales bacterium]|nr:hypothetical protein [Phycisphaerales bacterium]
MNATIACQLAYQHLDASDRVDEDLCRRLVAASLEAYQAAALLLRLARRPCTNAEQDLARRLTNEHPSLLSVVALLSPRFSLPFITPSDGPQRLLSISIFTTVMRHLVHRYPIDRPMFDELLRAFLQGHLPKMHMACVLTLIMSEGLSPLSTEHLTQAIVATGETVDIRPAAELRGQRVLRRYPTGGVSDKIALLMPSLLVASNCHLPVKSCFLVGRALGFTGGTWDKLAAIPGFTFARSADSVLQLLSTHGVAMCTTTETIAPADRELYLLRSETGTIASMPLVVSSVASKHLALPAHRILFDVRYGLAAFLETHSDAQSVGAALCSALHAAGTAAEAAYYRNEHPTGSTIGSALEMAEALTIMGARSQWLCFDQRAIDTQRDLLVAQTLTLLCAEFPEEDPMALKADIVASFQDGRLLATFRTMLLSHGSSAAFVDSVCHRPESLLKGLSLIPVHSLKSGQLKSLDQMGLGRIVNFSWRPPGSMAPGANHAGIQLHVQCGDTISAGDNIADCYVSLPILQSLSEDQIRSDVRNCLHIH